MGPYAKQLLPVAALGLVILAVLAIMVLPAYLYDSDGPDVEYAWEIDNSVLPNSDPKDGYRWVDVECIVSNHDVSDGLDLSYPYGDLVWKLQYRSEIITAHSRTKTWDPQDGLLAEGWMSSFHVLFQVPTWVDDDDIKVTATVSPLSDGFSLKYRPALVNHL